MNNPSSHSDATQRLNQWIEICFNGKVSEAAKSCQFHRSGFYKYTTGEQQPGTVVLNKIKGAGGNPIWIQWGVGEMFADNAAGAALREKVQGGKVETVSEELVAYRVDWKRQMMRMFLTPVRAGMASPMKDDEEGFELVNLSDEVQLPREGGWMLEVMGESMVADCILPGDKLIVSKTEPSNGDVVVAAYNGSPTVKRYATKGRTVWLYPSDVEQKRDPIKVLPDDTLVVWGVVHAIIHPVRRKPVGR